MNALPIPLSPTAQATMMLQQQATNMQMQSGIFIPPQMMSVSEAATQFIKRESPSSHEMPPRSPTITSQSHQQTMEQVKSEGEKPPVTTTTTTTPSENNNAMEST